MKGFLRRARVQEALSWIDRVARPLGAEDVHLAELGGRVLATDIRSDVDVPSFDRAMMDGFAVRAADTSGASPYNRLPLAVVGEVLPGRKSSETVGSGQAIRIMTGSPMPEGADAVLPAEHVEIGQDSILALHEVSPGKHVGRRGEDVSRQAIVLARGRRLRPQDLGVLSSIGVASVPVIRRVRVRLVVTGNELLPPGTKPTDSRVADANSPMLAALVERDGGIPINPGIIADEPEEILAAMLADAEVVLVSGGSSVGQEDHAPGLLSQWGELALHGIAMRPSSPSGMGTLDHRLVFLLPGNPVSCLCAYDFFAGRAIRTMAGLPKLWPYRQVRRRLGRKLVSAVGRVDYARVRLIDDAVEPLSVGGASVLSSTTRADGFVVIPEDSEGAPAGADVTVWLYD
jgi:molybdopterin molybdotransferase